MTELRRLLDVHAPEKEKTITEREDSEWFTTELGKLKSHLRKLERKHKCTGLAIDLEIYESKCCEYELLRESTKKHYYNEAVMDCNGNQGTLFTILNRLLHRSSSSPLPTSESNATLAQNFGDFFLSKITKIQDSLHSPDIISPSNICDIEPLCPAPLEVIEPVTPEDLSKLITAYSIKACPLDPIPARVFKLIYQVLLPVVVQIVNRSLSMGIVPLTLKER